MRHTLAPIALAILLATPSAGQSIYIDVGHPAAVNGSPSSSYGAAAAPGVWQNVDQQVTTGLLDTDGNPTQVALSLSDNPAEIDCSFPGITGDDAALFDDRAKFDAFIVDAIFSGLESGRYRVHVYLVAQDSCVGFMPPLEVKIAGATPLIDTVDGFWTGQLAEDLNYSNQVVDLAPGSDLLVRLETLVLFCCYTQLCGL